MANLNDFRVVAGVTQVKAIQYNRTLDSTLRGDMANTETLAANKTLVDADFPLQVLNPTAARDVTLPAVAASNHPFNIVNANAIYALTVKNAGGTVIGIVAASSSGNFASNGATWYTLFSIGSWTAGTGVWSYSSADAPIFVISVNNDQTGIIGVGMKIKLTQGTDKYFIVHAVGAFSGGVTLLTVYGGTDFTLANSAIATPSWSSHEAPLGFNLNRDKWSVILFDTTNASIATPTHQVWLNPGSLSIVAPIGAWNVSYSVVHDLSITPSVAQVYALRFSLSLSNSSESTPALTASNGGTLPVMTGALARFMQIKSSIVLTVAAKTPLYLMSYWGSGTALSVSFRGDLAPTRVQLVDAYL